MRNRAFRRKQLLKKKKLAREIYPDDQNATFAEHLAICSCYTCGNPRKHFGEITIQEKKSLDRMKEDF